MNTYGSQNLFIMMKGGHYYLMINVAREKKKAINQDSEPCTNSKSPDTRACFAKWIQDKIGCRIKMYGGSGNDLDQLSPCNTEPQLQEFWEIMSKMKYADAKIIQEQTGCLGSCEIYEYEKLDYTKDQVGFLKPSCKQGLANCSLSVNLEIPQEEITYRGTKQYVVYDFNSFIADVGGFMGLLLGFSILSLYEELENVVKRGKICSLPK